ncbi:neprilysin-11-like isoform X2 [Adelges cooleyi]|nr:neprilysin-11-like isoform X2 [Adelges cooleyi]XP_050422698.1 neprilysin-11-like isoform X2 [Adelges cooleyi]
MAPPGSTYNHQQQQQDGYVSVASMKYRKLQQVLLGNNKFEKKIILGLGLLSFLCFLLITAVLWNGMNSNWTTCQSDECLISATTIMQSMNAAVDPCDDFYEFACGNWQDRYLPGSGQVNSWFIERTRYISMVITRILEEWDHKNDLRSLKQARLLYRTCLNTDLLDEVGYEPVYKILEKLGLPRTFPDFTTATYANGTTFNMARTLALAQRYLSADILVQLSLEPDPFDKISALYFAPATGTSAPLPDVLVDYGEQRRLAMATADQTTARAVLLLKVRYMISVIAELTQDDNNNVTSMAVIALKILILESKLKREHTDQGAPTKFTFSDLSSFMTSNSSDVLDENTFDWSSYIQALTEGTNKTLTMDDVVYVRDPEYFLGLQSQMTSTSIEEFQQLVWWKIVEILIPHTTTKMRKLKSSFIESIYQTDKKPTRSSVCTEITKTFLNMPIAYAFYRRDGLHDTSMKVREMLGQLQKAFKTMIMASPWTDRTTKLVTSQKVDAIQAEIGYPKIFDSPSELEKLFQHVDINEDQFLQSMLDIKAFEVARVIEEIGNPIAKNTPQSTLTDPLEVNAFYSRTHNSITIPAGILQMPFFYKGVDVINYGAIGSILGHEMTHGFDIEGKNYDVNGKKTMWWGQQTIREYVKRAQCFIKEYDQFSLTKNIRLNGTQTLAENMADNIGLKQAWLAYKIYQSEHQERLPGLKGFTNDQLFFLAYANVWCHKTNAKFSELQANDDHSPNNIRVIGSLKNNYDFANVWKCPANSPMNPSNKCVMW